jgi:hypothetical protein
MKKSFNIDTIGMFAEKIANGQSSALFSSNGRSQGKRYCPFIR